MDFTDFINEINALPVYEIELGVIAGKSKARKNSGVTNAELMFIHENGSPLRHIPKRPVLRKTLIYVRRNWLKDEMKKALEIFINSGCSQAELEKELNKFCMRIQTHARNIIYDNNGELMENAISTMRAKWKKEKHGKGAVWTYPEGNHPLFDTGQLARSIVCQLNTK